MNIPHIPDGVPHGAWIGFLQSVGFDTRGHLVRIVADNAGPSGLTVTDRLGNVVIVPFVTEESK